MGTQLTTQDLRRKLKTLSIEAQVKLHAQTAYTLATMERRPPGYTAEAWAVYLMDKPREELQQRLIDRAERHLGPVTPANLLFQPYNILPVIPDKTPGELAPKMIQLDREWTRDLFQRRAHAAVAEFVGSPRSAGVLRAASARVERVYGAMSQEIGVKLPFTVKLHMTKDGQFVVSLEG
jgi:hypothetical protein